MSAQKIQPLEHVPLAPRTTLELGGAAAFLIEVNSVQTLFEGLEWAAARGVKTAVLGSGSNLVVPDEGFDGLVLAMGLKGRRATVEADVVVVHAAAGEPWDELVQWAVEHGWSGLECLSGIPGLVGASPVQNVGAYGQEVSDTVRSVQVFDTQQGVLRRLPASECGFGYRDSVFKRTSGRFIVTEVEFGLRANAVPTLRYGELTNRLAGQAVTVASVRAAVLELRRSKSMVYSKADPNHRSAGSFFMNPVVSAELAASVVARARSLGVAGPVPSWPASEGQVKLAAGWLIERSGFQKGQRVGAVGLSSAHALALVHHGQGSTRELLAFANSIVAGVEQTFGVRLQREPVLLGHDDLAKPA